MDPLRDAEADRKEAEDLDWQARREEDPNLRRSLVDSSNRLEQQAENLEEEVEEEKGQEQE